MTTKTPPAAPRFLLPIALATAVILSLTGCADTFGGARQDTIRNTDNAKQNLNTAGQAISNTANSAGQAIDNTANSVANHF